MADLCASARRRQNFWCRDLSPGAIRPPWPKPERNSAPDGARDLGPFAIGAFDHQPRIGEKFGARLVVVEEIEPLARHRPDQGVARHRHAAGDGHRVVAAEAWRIDLRMIGKSRTVAIVDKAPDRAVLHQLDLRIALHRLLAGEISDRVEAADGKPGVGIDHQPIIGRGSEWPRCYNTGNDGEAGQCAKCRLGKARTPRLPLLPWSSHSSKRDKIDSGAGPPRS